jgi:hypothetical protein
MAVVDTNPVNAAYTNSKLMSRTSDTSTTGKIALLNSGSPTLNDTQKDINDIFDAVGMAGENDANANLYSSNEVIVDGESYKESIVRLDEEFHETTGHNHDGTSGNGPKIAAGNLAGFNNYFAEFQSKTITAASGTTFNVSSNFSGESPGGGTSNIGVITTAPYNKISIVNASTLTAIEDAGGQRVYARLTEAATVWTLSFYTNEAGVETAHNLSATDILIVYYQVYTAETRPTIPSNPLEFGTLDITGDVVDATVSQRGVVSTGTQSFAGLKTLTDGFVVEDLIRLAQTDDSSTTGSDQTIAPTNTLFALTNGGLVSVAGISGGGGNKLQYVQNKTGVTLSLKHENVAASATDRIQTPTGLDMDWKANQVFTFIYNTTSSRWALAGDSGGSLFSLSAIGATPNANGASYNSGTGAFNLQPANASFGGVMTTGGQSFAGYKEFTDGLMVEEDFRLNISNDSASGSLAELTTNVNPVKRMTNASLVSIAGMVEPALNCRVQIIINNTGNAISIVNEEGTITAARRILTGTGNNMDVANNAAVMIIYNYNASRWQVVGGSGGGGTRVSAVKTADYTITTNDSVILANPTSGDITLTLPTASTATGKTFTVKRTHATANALKVTSAQNIDGATDNFIDNQYDFVNYYCDGSTYWIL